METMDAEIWGIILDHIYEIFYPLKMTNKNLKNRFKNLDR